MRRFLLLALAMILTMVWTVPTMASKLTNAQQEKKNVESQKKAITEKKKEESKKLTNALEQKKTVEATKKVQDQQYNQLVNELSQMNEELDGLEKSVKDSEERYIEQRELFKQRIRVMYQNSTGSYLEILANAESILDLFNRFELISRIAQKDKQTIEELDIAKKDVEYKKALQEQVVKKTQAKASKTKQDINKLKLSRAQLEEQIRLNKANLEKLEKEEDELNKKAGELAKLIASLQISNSKYAGGVLKWPTPGYTGISSYFGMRIHPIYKKQKMHTGLDVDAPMGASIVAANSGTVKISGWQSGYGNTVAIDHGGGIATLYGHCSKLLVNVGDKVQAGQVIAKVGSTGLSTGPHLHFEVIKNGSQVNPMSYFGK